MMTMLRLRIRRLFAGKRSCIVCADKSAPWVWQHTRGKVRMCEWHNSQAQANRIGQPLRREGVAA